MGCHWCGSRSYTGTKLSLRADLMLARYERTKVGGVSHLLYGGARDVVELLASGLRERFPRSDIAGTCTPPFRALTEDEADDIARSIHASGASIVWVELSTPKQEYWLHAFTAPLPHAVARC
jgi:N-acetylglucosaminyldiphosphoundecaprenol N-acetyl-beta-D-mannosaminyltransferase